MKIWRYFLPRKPPTYDGGGGPTQKEPRARDAGPGKETVVLPWWGNHNVSEIPKQGDSGAHKQKPRPHMPEGRGLLSLP